MREIKEIPLTEDDIVDILLRYKPALAKIFRQSVDLEIDEEGEIHAFTTAGGMSLEPIVNTSIKAVGLEELKAPVAIVKLVEERMKNLTVQQRKALFYRYIDHDMRRGYPEYLDKDDWRVKYHTRSLSQVAKKLEVKKQSAQALIERALKRILKNTTCGG